MPVTIHDIARLAHVDKSTVSMTLRNHPNARNLRAETRERIRKIARELGYQSNTSAVSIRTGQVNTVAVIGEFGKERMILYSVNLAGIILEASRLNFGIKLFSDLDLKQTFAAVNANRIRHVISMSVEKKKREETAGYARKLGLDLVYIYEHPHEGYPCVTIDNVEAASQAVRHLASLGHRRIALACVPHCFHYIEERHEGYLRGLEESGLPPDPDLIFCSDDTETHIRRLLALPARKRPSAVFAIGDNLAMLTEKTAVQVGFRLPDDLSVFGFGNDPAGKYALSSLSTIEECFELRGRIAVKMLIEKKYELSPARPGFYLVPPKLVIRESTVPWNRSTPAAPRGISSRPPAPSGRPRPKLPTMRTATTAGPNSNKNNGAGFPT